MFEVFEQYDNHKVDWVDHQFGEFNPIYLSYARNGIFLAAQWVKRETRKKQVLVPAYTCGDEIKPYIQAGYEVIAYDIQEDFGIDLSAVRSLISNNNIAVLHMTHYFNHVPGNLQAIVNLCRENDVLVLQDFAHTFPQEIQFQGDFAILSMRKHLPVPDGGLLLSKSSISADDISQDLIKMSREATSFSSFIYLGQKNKLFPLGTSIGEIYQAAGYSYGESLHGPRLAEFGGYKLTMSGFTRFLLDRVDVKVEATNRVRRYSQLEAVLGKKSIAKPEGTPYCFVVKTDDSEKLHDQLMRRGINIGNPFWGHYHKYIDWENFPISNQLKRQLYMIRLEEDIAVEDNQLRECLI